MDRDKQIEKNDDMVVIKLDAERRREIDEVRTRFEGFYRDEIKFQADMRHSLQMVTQKQDHLKERFEAGTASTLRELRSDFSTFLMEWGKKQEQDKTRDIIIETIDTKATDTRKELNLLTRSLIISVCGGFIISVILYAFNLFKG